MVFKLDNMNTENMIDIIANTVQLPSFRISPEARKYLDNLSLEYEIKANLVEKFPTTRYVSAKDGKVTVIIETTLKDKEKVGTEMDGILRGIDGVKELDIRFKH